MSQKASSNPSCTRNIASLRSKKILIVRKIIITEIATREETNSSALIKGSNLSSLRKIELEITTKVVILNNSYNSQRKLNAFRREMKMT